jgi:predicted Zn-dependent protease with MMP-like domain
MVISITDEEFQQLIDEAFERLPREHRDHISNVAILYADEPSPEQREHLALRHDQTLFGLYEGIPLSQRQGMSSSLPDKITLFKLPLTSVANDIGELREEIYHTLWHEVAHYYGLNHEQIGRLE